MTYNWCKKEYPRLRGYADRLTASEPEFYSRWYPYKSLVAAGRTSGHSCSCAPVLTTFIAPSKPLNKGVNAIFEFGHTVIIFIHCKLSSWSQKLYYIIKSHTVVAYFDA